MKNVYHSLAAGSLGLLVGLLAGLSVSPVVASLLGIVGAAATVLLGIRPAEHAAAAAPAARLDQQMMARVGGFAVLCVAGVLWGVYLRTHDVLTPSPHDQVRHWIEAGFSPAEARAIVRLRNTGSAAAGANDAGANDAGGKDAGSTAAAARPGTAAATLPTALYSNPAADDCRSLEPRRYKDAAEVLNAYRLEKGDWGKDAERVEKHVPRVEDRLPVLEFLWREACEP